MKSCPVGRRGLFHKSLQKEAADFGPQPFCRSRSSSAKPGSGIGDQTEDEISTH